MSNDPLKDLLERLGDGSFIVQAVQSGFEKMMLEASVNAGVTPIQRDQELMRASVMVGVTEALIKLQELMSKIDEEGEDR